MMRLLRQYHVRWFTAEDAAPFCVTDRRMDIVVAPGCMQLACEEEFGLKGVLIDHTVRCPTVSSYLPKAAEKAGYAAKIAEKQKRVHYEGRAGSKRGGALPCTFDKDRFVLVPFVQESYGRFGNSACKFVGVLASHAAACLGGSQKVVEKRAGVYSRQIMTELSLALAREMAERVLAYVRCAALMGRNRHPVSALLRLSA
jgi:hypothetical protein